jgi:hypothetical protein
VGWASTHTPGPGECAAVRGRGVPRREGHDALSESARRRRCWAARARAAAGQRARVAAGQRALGFEGSGPCALIGPRGRGHGAGCGQAGGKAHANGWAARKGRGGKGAGWACAREWAGDEAGPARKIGEAKPFFYFLPPFFILFQI